MKEGVNDALFALFRSSPKSSSIPAPDQRVKFASSDRILAPETLSIFWQGLVEIQERSRFACAWKSGNEATRNHHHHHQNWHHCPTKRERGSQFLGREANVTKWRRERRLWSVLERRAIHDPAFWSCIRRGIKERALPSKTSLQLLTLKSQRGKWQGQV